MGKSREPEEDAPEPDSEMVDNGSGAEGAPRASAEPDAAAANELAEALREKAQFRALLQRVQADFINYRKRVQTEQEEIRVQAARPLILRLLEVMDEFDSALEGHAADSVPAQWLEGVQAIRRKLAGGLSSAGVERFGETSVDFDPHLHEALLTRPTAEHPANSVLQVLRPGYKHSEDVIRPAQVEIAVPLPDDAVAGPQSS